MDYLSSCHYFLMEFGDLLVPWTSFGPRQSHLGPPGAPSWPEVTIFYDIWGHFGAHFGDWRRIFWCLQASGAEKGGLGQALRTRAAFSSILGSAPRCSGGFSLQRELSFHFGGQWQIMSTLGSILKAFCEPEAQLGAAFC